MKIKSLVPAVRAFVTLSNMTSRSCVYTTVGKSRRLGVDEIENEFLKEDWLPDTVEHRAIHSYVISNTEMSGREWTAEQVGIYCTSDFRTNILASRSGDLRKSTERGDIPEILTLQLETRIFTPNSIMITVSHQRIHS